MNHAQGLVEIARRLLSENIVTIKQVTRVVAGSFVFFTLKATLVFVLVTHGSLPAWANYLLVHLFLTLLGWVYHSKVSFRVALSRVTFIRYIKQAIVLKATDYVLYNVLVYWLGLNEIVSVFLTAGIFVIRVIVFLKYVFAHHACKTGPEVMVD